jgi:hypothetical protein
MNISQVKQTNISMSALLGAFRALGSLHRILVIDIHLKDEY